MCWSNSWEQGSVCSRGGESFFLAWRKKVGKSYITEIENEKGGGKKVDYVGIVGVIQSF